MTTPVIYSGIKFPFQKGPGALPAPSTDDELIRESLLQLVLTMNGERIMRPGVGTNALSFIFENNGVVLSNLLRSEIQGVVAKYEPRVQVTDVVTEQRESTVIVTIVYLILASRTLSTTAITIPVP